MSNFIDDDFESYAIGTLPSTWRAVSLGASVQNGGIEGSKGLQLNPGGGAQKDPLIDVAVGVQTSVSVFHAFQGGGGGNMLSLHNANPADLSGDIDVLDIIMEADTTITVQIGNKIIGNTQTINPWKDWMYMQLNVDFSAVFDAGLGFNVLKAVVSLAVQGTTLINALSGQSTIPSASLAAGIGCNLYQFRPTDNSSMIDIVTVANPQLAMGTYPHPGSPKARVSQVVVEPVELANPSTARVSQLAAEMVELPSSEKVRVSQLVIELIAAAGVQTQWMIYEA